MISANNISLSYGSQVLFKDVNLKFSPEECYGIIGANGAGKSTFLKILSGEIEPDSGEVFVTPGQRLSFMRQDHFAFDKYSVIETVIMGYGKLYKVMKEKDAIYEKPDFSEEDGMRAAELEGEFSDLGGWEAEAQAAQLLDGLGISTDLHDKLMGDMEDSVKVKVLLAQALFGNPDILLLDEPTNHLDLESITWLENFIDNFDNTVIVVSHDRHFLNSVCTQIVDIDYGKATLYVGNYDFWYESSQLAAKQMKDEKKRADEKIAELKSFIQRFASNAAKSKQATSRKKLIEKLTIDDIRPSSRRFPYVGFKMQRELGKNILEVKDLTKTIDGEKVLDHFNLMVNNGDKIAFVGPNQQAKTALFEILAGNAEPDEGSYTWGVTTSLSYFPKDNTSLFKDHVSITDWLMPYAPEKDDTYVRSFLGRMLFSGDEALKDTYVLSGGEKVRIVLTKMMMQEANCMILDEPTSHLDLESITALNDGLIAFKGVLLFNSHDHQFIDTIANRIIEFTPGGIIDKMMSFEDYLHSDQVKAERDAKYGGLKHKLSL